MGTCLSVCGGAEVFCPEFVMYMLIAQGMSNAFTAAKHTWASSGINPPKKKKKRKREKEAHRAMTYQWFCSLQKASDQFSSPALLNTTVPDASFKASWTSANCSLASWKLEPRGWVPIRIRVKYSSTSVSEPFKIDKEKQIIESHLGYSCHIPTPNSLLKSSSASFKEIRINWVLDIRHGVRALDTVKWLLHIIRLLLPHLT